LLILSRKYGESIQIGDSIEIVVVDITRDRVSIGINAPKDVKIVRTELTDNSSE
jgi:carbon storage regulator